MPAAFRARTWSCIREISGETTSVIPGSSTAGSTPQLPAVGAATMHFMQALLSPISSACASTVPMYSPQMVFPDAA